MVTIVFVGFLAAANAVKLDDLVAIDSGGENSLHDETAWTTIYVGGGTALSGSNKLNIGDNDYTYGIQPSWNEYYACVTPHAACMRAWQRNEEAMDYWEADALFCK